MKVKVNVTRDVLERSKMCGHGDDIVISRHCGIAVAVIDLFPDANVQSTFINLLGCGGLMSYLPALLTQPDFCRLPYEAINFIDDFDYAEPEERVLMSPFSFEIEVPEYVINKIGIGEIYRVLSESKTLELVMEDFGQTVQS